MLVPRISDTVCNPPLDHFSVYIEHIRVGLRFSLLPLVVELLGFYGIALMQLVPNAIRVITGIEKLYRSNGVISSLALFRTFFYLKSSRNEGWYQIAPRLSRPIRVILPNKVSRWKDTFFFCRIPRSVQLLGFWRTEKIIEGVGPSSPEGFEDLNVTHTIRVDFEEVEIPRGSEADYHWAEEGMLLHFFKICGSFLNISFAVTAVQSFLGQTVAERSAPQQALSHLLKQRRSRLRTEENKILHRWLN